VNEKAKEMTKLYASIEQFEDGQDDRRKKMSRIDLAIKNLEDEKATLVKEYDSAAESITKLENKRKKLESFLEAFAAKSKQKTAVLEMEIKDLKEQLNSNDRKEISTSVEMKIKPNPELLQFINRQIEELEKELECPVCLELATNHIYKCDDDHLVCSGCRTKMTACPVCRNRYPQGGPKRFRGAERSSEKLSNLYLERAALV